MLEGLYSAATALKAGQFNHDVVSENLAHLNVPGYRRSVPTFESFDRVLIEQGEKPGLRGGGTVIESDATDFSTGPLTHTNRSLDVAINGEGFFSVEGSDGQSYYTRNGVFFIGQDGSLMNSTGMTVLGDGGPLSIPTGSSPSDVTISNDGSVSVRGTAIGKLRLVAFADNSQLERAGTTLFRAPDGVVPSESDASVQQGMREQSNVSAVDEMVQMIKGMRYYEAAQRALKQIDDSISNNTDPRT